MVFTIIPIHGELTVLAVLVRDFSTHGMKEPWTNASMHAILTLEVVMLLFMMVINVDLDGRIKMVASRQAMSIKDFIATSEHKKC